MRQKRNTSIKNGSEHLAVFDVDGTITTEGHDSWLETTYSMVNDMATLESYLATWRKNKKNNPYKASLRMMQQAISLFPYSTSSTCVYETGKKGFSKLIRNNQVRLAALKTIRKHYSEGLQIVFSTASYNETGQSLVDVLSENGLLDEGLCKSIIVIGTHVDWPTRQLQHFNMSDGKLNGISRRFKLQPEEVRSKILFAYGDDPLGNDSGILRAAINGFVVHTLKNANIKTKNIGERVIW